MKKHTDALVALAETVPNVTAVYVSIAKNADQSDVAVPYVVIHPADGRDDSDRLAGPSVTQHPRFTVLSVGKSPDEAAWIAERLKAVLIVGGIGVVPIVPGERSGTFWYSSPQPIQVDTDAFPPLIWHTAEVGFESTPNA